MTTLGALDEPAQRPPGATPERITLPAPRVRRATARSYAFLVHFTRIEDIALNDPALAGLSPEELRRYCAFAAELPAGLVFGAPPIRSATGAVAEGSILVLPLLAEEMLRRGSRRMSDEIAHAVDLAASLGATVVGLGGFTTPLSRRGLAVIGRGPAITTGNVLTAGMAYEATRRAAERRGPRLADARVAVVGARGSVGALSARLFARGGVGELRLVGNAAHGNAGLLRLADEIERAYGVAVRVSALDDIGDCDVVFSATGAARPVLDRAPLARGTLVCDVARPSDASPELRAARPDLFVIDGGLVALPGEPARFGPANLQGLPNGVQLACLAETILHALVGEPRDRGIGDDLSVVDVDETMALARHHGFLPATALDDARAARVGA